MELTEEVRIYFFNHNVGVLDTRITRSRFVYIETDDLHSMYRYSLESPEMLQHDVGHNEWRDIWLGVRREQTALF
ncbi:hypothetical protein ITQ85_01635 [Pediococcus pentosaceus]|uniref:Uncharacterized protein n=1 Tax=Pediococcus pentosaceus TaxID=1255 RepID=A0AB73HEF9_PEDPE|nr:MULTISPECIES: hypothetical protein [Pediococcus]KAF5440909.1 hypothetical protein HFC69_01275 [Pediococcus sp. EKM202D]KAF5441528.1 hypothetical protein HFC68_01605 [Pediococcus sp. EKM201D]MBF7112606.1 hypothetical protein [Pediococcus pentosaceus]MBF7114500.1 hypothetical protein [Pediococcus pentosaceus]QHM61071.1 hypothetical protein C7M46_01785 [Pediococcus pentosaceus]